MVEKMLSMIATLFILCLFIMFFSVNTQENENMSMQITPTSVIFPPPQFGEPELICPYFREVESGFDWRGITIGMNTQDDLESLLEQLGRYELVLPIEGTLSNSIGYRWQDSRDKGILQQAPAQLDICVQDKKIVVLDMTWFYQSPLYIDDLLASLGEPDIVTWSTMESSRIAFWFEFGVAIDVFVQSGDAESFGLVTRVIYFPTQSKEGYESKWPFNITRKEPFNSSDPSIPNERNPFDFDSIIATVTAEPTRTPTAMP